MFEEKYKLKKNLSTSIFLILWVILFTIYIFKNSLFLNIFKDNVIETFIFLFAAIFFFLKSIWTLLGEVKYEINNEEFIETKIFLGIKISKKSYIHNIYNIKVERRKSSNYWGGNGFRIYDTEEDILILCHKGKEIEVGKGLANFQAKKIYLLLNKNKRVH